MTMLTTYKLQFDFTALDRANLADTTRDQYRKAILRLVETGISPFDSAALASYAAQLPHSSRAFLKSALNLMSQEYQRMLKANATTERAEQIQVALWKLEAMDKAILIHTPKGKAASIWLSPAQIEHITSLPNNTIQGKRDWIILAVLLGAGLRRSELSSLTFENIKRQPMKDGQLRAVLDIIGKGRKKRVIPISALLESRLNEWMQITGGGNVARSINKAGVLNGSLSDKSINEIVHKYGALIGLPELEAHDCRRTWAQCGYNAGIPLAQISTLLGHANLPTTQRYLDLHTDLSDTISDHIPLSERQ